MMREGVWTKFLLFSLLAILGFATIAQYLPAVDRAWVTAIVVVVTVILWAGHLLPPWFVALLFIGVCCLGKLVPTSVALQGFQASATWLVFAGMVIGLAMKHTQLGETMAKHLTPYLYGSYVRALLGFMALGTVCIFIMPSAMGRVVLLVPLYIALANKLGYDSHSTGRTHLLLGGVLATYLPAFAVLPANVPNNVLLGTTESLLGKGPDYFNYFLIHFPVLGAIKLVVIFIILWWPLRNADVQSDLQPAAVDEGDNNNTGRNRLTIILSLMMLLWLSEPLHHLPTAWIAMAAALCCLFPGAGIVPTEPLKKIDIASLFYVAGVISLGLVAENSQLADWLTQSIQQLPLDSNSPSSLSFTLLSALSSVVGVLVTLPAAPAILTPLTNELADTLKWSPEAIYMTQIVGLSCVWLPYQAPPLMIAKTMANLPWRTLIRYCLLLSVLSVVVIWPLDYLWWKLIGVI